MNVRLEVWDVAVIVRDHVSSSVYLENKEMKEKRSWLCLALAPL